MAEVLKTVVGNSFVGWRVVKRQDLLDLPKTLKSLETYRHSLNNAQSLGDFYFELMKAMLHNAKTTRDIEYSSSFRSYWLTPSMNDVIVTKICIIYTLAPRTNRKRLMFLSVMKVDFYICPQLK